MCPGGSVFLVVFANGGALQYQWLKDGVAIPGATGPFLSIGPLGSRDSGVYTAEVTNGCGTVVSAEAVVDVDESHCL